jgi:hypothetical protein
VGFVEVPVPEEHVYEVMRWVLFRSHEWTADAVERAVERIVAFASAEGPPMAALFERVASSAMQHDPLRLRDLADELDMPSQQLSAMVDDANERALDGEPVLERTTQGAVGIHGQAVHLAYLSMHIDIARRLHPALRRSERNDA